MKVFWGASDVYQGLYTSGKYSIDSPREIIRSCGMWLVFQTFCSHKCLKSGTKVY